LELPFPHPSVPGHGHRRVQRDPVRFHRFETAGVFIIRRSPHREGWSQHCPLFTASPCEAQPAQLSQGDRIMHDQISEGFMVFVSDGAEGVGSVREIRHGLPELLVYIENAGDFVIPLSAVKAVHSDKVILDFDHLDLRMRDAIRHARDSEDPDYVSPASEDE
jgi:hypothetical protein